MTNRKFDYDYDCSPQAEHDHYPGRVWQPNDGIVGIGVLIGFAGSTMLAVLLLFTKYLFAHDPTVSPFICSKRKQKWEPNIIDVGFLSFFRRQIRVRGSQTFPRLIDECVLQMCDFQAITGLAILVSGFASLQRQDDALIASDWSTLAYLAWFSASTYLAGLTCLRAYLNEYPRTKVTRVVFAVPLLILLIVAIVPTGLYEWETTSFLTPAMCYFDLSTATTLWKHRPPKYAYRGSQDTLADSPAFQSMLMAILVLVVGFAGRCMKLSASLTRFVEDYIRSPMRSGAQYLIGTTVRFGRALHDRNEGRSTMAAQIWTDLVLLPATGLYLCVRWTAAICTSVLTETVWVTFMITWGLIKLISIRIQHLTVQRNSGSQDVELTPWSLGQVIAVVLLMSPLLSLARKFFARRPAEENVQPAQAEQQRDIEHALDLSHPLDIANSRPHTPVTPEVQPSMAESAIRAGRPAILLPKAGENPMTSSVQEMTNAKLLLAEHILADENDSNTADTWTSVCVASACLYWIVTAAIASALTNNYVGFDESARAWTRKPFQTMVAFWFTREGMLWKAFFNYPVIVAATAALGMQFQVLFSHARTSKIASRCSMTFLCIFNIVMQVMTLSTSGMPRGLLWFFSPTGMRILGIRLDFIQLPLQFYVMYAAICVAVPLLSTIIPTNGVTLDQAPPQAVMHEKRTVGQPTIAPGANELQAGRLGETHSGTDRCSESTRVTRNEAKDESASCKV